MALPFIDGPTIAAGESMSDAVDCQGFWILRFFMPDDWTRAPLTFQVSVDGEEFHDLYHTQATGASFVGYEVIVPEVEAGVSLTLPLDTGGPVNWIRLRSGTRDRPIVQEAERAFRILLDDTRAQIPGPAGAVGPAGPVGPTGPAPTPANGVTDGSEVAAGRPGEILAAVNLPGISLVTGVTANVTTLSVPPGDYMLGGIVIFTPTGTGPNSILSGCSTVAATMPTETQTINGTGSLSQIWSGSLTSGKVQTLPTGAFRLNVSVQTPVYLVANASFGGGSVLATGRITASRRR